MNTSTPVLLLIAPPNSYRTWAYLDAARKLELPVLVVSEGDHALVTGMTGGLHIDFSDPDAVPTLLRAIAGREIAGIVATDDHTVELSSKVAQALGVSHNPPGAARISRRKDLARACLRQAGVPVPDHRLIDLRTSLSPQIKDQCYPCVAKPVSLSGSRGVIRANNAEELMAAITRIGHLLGKEDLSGDEGRSVLVESFVPGPEFAVEAMLHQNQLEILAVFSKPDPLDGPYFEETYYISPAALDERQQSQLIRRVTEACRVYGLREGPVHAELRWHNEDAWIMEVASRTIGGHCGQLLRFVAGHDLEDLVISHAVGRPLPTASDTDAAGVLMIPIRQGGILRRVEGIPAARRVPYIEDVQITLRDGYELVPLPEGSQYLGFVFARAPDAKQVEAALRAAHECLNVVVAPVWHGIVD